MSKKRLTFAQLARQLPGSNDVVREVVKVGLEVFQAPEAPEDVDAVFVTESGQPVIVEFKRGAPEKAGRKTAVYIQSAPGKTWKRKMFKLDGRAAGARAVQELAAAKGSPKRVEVTIVDPPKRERVVRSAGLPTTIDRNLLLDAVVVASLAE